MTKRMNGVLLAASAIVSTLSVTTPAAALNIVLHADSSFTNSANGSAALLGFQKAANYWNQTLTNNVTINFDVHFDALRDGVLGSTYSNSYDTAVSLAYARMAATGKGALDATAVANLRPLSTAGGLAYRGPGTDPATGLLTTTAAGSALDNNNSYNNLFLNSNTAVDRALGIAVDNSQTLFGLYGAGLGLNRNRDGDITFSSNFAFDFDPTNGVSVGTYDFVGVAIHEIGHALGFVSGTDDYDGAYVGNYSRADIDGTSVLTNLDLFRYGANNPTADGTYQLQLDPNRDAFFSVDARNPFVDDEPDVQTSSYFSTGRNFGDGQQASHWRDVTTGRTLPNGCFKSDRQVGIMDPTIDNCAVGAVTGNDLAAFDAIGWNLGFDVTGEGRKYRFSTAQAFALDGLATAVSVPEPSQWALMVGGFGLLGGAIRRRKAKVSVTFA